MKITLNIDDDLLERVMISTDSTTKTDAIHFALSEMDRRAKLIAVLAESDLTTEELRNAVDPASDPMNFRYSVSGTATHRVAEDSPNA